MTATTCPTRSSTSPKPAAWASFPSRSPETDFPNQNSITKKIAALLVTLPPRAEDSQKIAYPTTGETLFLIDAPTSWELTPAEEDGDYFHLTGPNDSKKFTDVEMGDAQDWTPGGLSGFFATGTAKEKDGTVVRIGVAWCAVSENKIAEMWFVADADDSDSLSTAEKIANSLATP